MSSKETSGVCDQKDFVCKLNVVASSVNVCTETEQEEGGERGGVPGKPKDWQIGCQFPSSSFSKTLILCAIDSHTHARYKHMPRVKNVMWRSCHVLLLSISRSHIHKHPAPQAGTRTHTPCRWSKWRRVCRSSRVLCGECTPCGWSIPCLWGAAWPWLI